MATYTFETITSADAQLVGLFDDLAFTSGSATQMSVRYEPDGSVTLIEGARSVTFGIAFQHMSAARDFTFPDHSLLYVGDDGANAKDYSQIKADVEMYGGAGADVLTGGQGLSVIQGNQGADTLSGSGTIYGGQDNDVINGDGFVQGNKGDDTITSHSQYSTLVGGQGDDVIHSGSWAGRIYGDLGNDQLLADTYQRLIDGGSGNDTITAVTGAANLDGGAGDDSIQSGSDSNWISGGDGNDTMHLDSVHATVSGGAGDDNIWVADFTYQRSNVLSGDDGNDTITAGPGDTVSGGAGDDDLNGGYMTGGPGADHFGMGFFFYETPTNRVLDWSSEDKVKVPNGGAASMVYSEATAQDVASAVSLFNASTAANDVMAIQVGSDVLVFTGHGNNPDEVTLVGRTLADIDATNFI